MIIYHIDKIEIIKFSVNLYHENYSMLLNFWIAVKWTYIVRKLTDSQCGLYIYRLLNRITSYLKK